MFANPWKEHFGCEGTDRGPRGGHSPSRPRGSLPGAQQNRGGAQQNRGGGASARPTMSNRPQEWQDRNRNHAEWQRRSDTDERFSPQRRVPDGGRGKGGEVLSSRTPDFSSRTPDFALDVLGGHAPREQSRFQNNQEKHFASDVDSPVADRFDGRHGTSQRQLPRMDDTVIARVDDTTIGKGFGEFLKRGVAQASVPGKEDAELVPSKDGGFIAAIQKGFEGIFGHVANSKEEVLKKRGPMTAPGYEAVPGDDIDQRVEFYAKQLPKHQGECLKLYRIERGKYKIGSDEVRLAWQQRINPPSNQAPAGSVTREVYVFTGPQADGQKGPSEGSECSTRATSSASTALPNPRHIGPSLQGPNEALPLFLRHSANIAYDLQFGNNGLSQVPEAARLSFAEETGTLLEHGDANAKWHAMTLATAQAKKREQHAKEHAKDQMRRKSSEEVLQQPTDVGTDGADAEKFVPTGGATGPRQEMRGRSASPKPEPQSQPDAQHRTPLQQFRQASAERAVLPPFLGSPPPPQAPFQSIPLWQQAQSPQPGQLMSQWREPFRQQAVLPQQLAQLAPPMGMAPCTAGMAPSMQFDRQMAPVLMSPQLSHVHAPQLMSPVVQARPSGPLGPAVGSPLQSGLPGPAAGSPLQLGRPCLGESASMISHRPIKGLDPPQLSIQSPRLSWAGAGPGLVTPGHPGQIPRHQSAPFGASQGLSFQPETHTLSFQPLNGFPSLSQVPSRQ